jgi:hypothetical protein
VTLFFAFSANFLGKPCKSKASYHDSFLNFHFLSIYLFIYFFNQPCARWADKELYEVHINKYAEAVN